MRQCVTRALELQLPLADEAANGKLMRLVNGPVSSAVAAALTLGWRQVAGCRWKTADGFELDLLSEAPLTVKKLAEEDATRLSWRRAAARHEHLAHLDRVPYLPAVHRLLADSGSLTVRQKGLLRAFMAGGFFRATSCTCGATFENPMRCWAHYVWECPGTAEGRAKLHTPQHFTHAISYNGLPEGFADRIRGYLHTPWVQTAWLPDPRGDDPPPANPAEVRWQISDDAMPLFSSSCCGDGSCTEGGRLPSLAARAGWAVVEVFRDIRGRIVIGRVASGTLPGPWQTAEGSELFALLFWLRHLDPTSRLVPRFYTDNQRVVDGYHGRFNIDEPWGLHRDLWMSIKVAREDARQDVQVIWRRGHVSRAEADRRDPLSRMIAYGNAWAHERARIASTWHPAATSAAAVNQTDAFAHHLAIAYARMLEWAVEVPGRLPAITPLERLFPRPRPPPLPSHTFAVDGSGLERCIRCYLPPQLAECRPCRARGSEGHSLMSLGSGVFCRKCGAYSFQRLELLGGECSGRITGGTHGSTAHRLRKLLQGCHPRTGKTLGQAAPIDPALAAFSVVLGDE